MVRGGGRAGKTARKACEMCGGSKLVAVEVARRYLEYLQRGSSSTGHERTVHLQPTSYVKSLSRD